MGATRSLEIQMRGLEGLGAPSLLLAHKSAIAMSGMVTVLLTVLEATGVATKTRALEMQRHFRRAEGAPHRLGRSSSQQDTKTWAKETGSVRAASETGPRIGYVVARGLCRLQKEESRRLH